MAKDISRWDGAMDGDKGGIVDFSVTDGCWTVEEHQGGSIYIRFSHFSEQDL